MRKKQLDELIAQELSKFRIAEARKALMSSFVKPYELDIQCSTEAEEPVFWCVAELSNKAKVLFALKNRRTGDHWVVLSSGRRDVDGDDFWFSTLEDAFYQSGAWNGQMPPDYEVS